LIAFTGVRGVVSLAAALAIRSRWSGAAVFRIAISSCSSPSG